MNENGSIHINDMSVKQGLARQRKKNKKIIQGVVAASNFVKINENKGPMKYLGVDMIVQ